MWPYLADVEHATAAAEACPKRENATAAWGSIRAMKNMLTIVTTLIVGSTLALGACGGKKATTTEPAAAAPADPKAAPTADETKAADKPKEETKGGW